jgi:hypothetical protein
MKKIGKWSRSRNGSIMLMVPKWSTTINGKKHEFVAIYGGKSASSHKFTLNDIEKDLLSEYGDHVKLVSVTKNKGDIMELE